jgi:glycosyltransferase involved in cell wall biosynthesis
MLAPPWIAVPPPAYGGIESVVAMLCDELVARGHAVTLFAAPGSRSDARVCSPLQDAQPRRMGFAVYDSDHVAYAYDSIDRAAAEGTPFDVIHDHSGFTAVATANRVSTPVVHTLHAPFDADTRPFYARHGHKVRLVAISRFQLDHAPPDVHITDVVPNPIQVSAWPLQLAKHDYLLWMGRFDPAKGAHRAIAAARHAGSTLVLAGPVQPGQEEYFKAKIEPFLDGDRVIYAGEVGGTRRRELFARAKGFLMPIRWAEPFGMVMIEALACGTPVIAFPEGAAPEIVIDGVNGFCAADEWQMAEAVSRLSQIDRLRCRESVAERYDVAIVAARYEACYRHAIGSVGTLPARIDRHRQPAPAARGGSGGYAALALGSRSAPSK